MYGIYNTTEQLVVTNAMRKTKAGLEEECDEELIRDLSGEVTFEQGPAPCQRAGHDMMSGPNVDAMCV